MHNLANHENPDTTLDICTHVNMEEKRVVTDAPQEVFA